MDSDCKGWTSSDNYPFIRIPFAHGVNLQWTIRDNHLINVPVPLLVKGDVIKLRPGQYIFANCQINPADNKSNDYSKTYSVGQTFVSIGKDENTEKIHFSDKSRSKVIGMKKSVTATVTETPVLSLLEEYLVNYSTKYAWSVSVPERYIEFSLNSLLLYILIVYILNVFVHIMWFIIVGKYHNIKWQSSTSYITLIGVPFHVPLLLLLTMTNSVWKIIAFLYNVDRQANLSVNIGSMERIPSSISSHSNDSDYSKPADITMDSIHINKWQYVQALWKQFICQDYQFQRMIFNLGSLTSLCCVDKKGILADPIVTPEKIFMYRKRHRHRSNSLMNLDKINKKINQDHINVASLGITSNVDSAPNVRVRSLTSDVSSNTFVSSIIQTTIGYSNKVSTNSPSIINQKMIPLAHVDSSLAIPVILDMTSSIIDPQLSVFDDNRWERYLSSLKPIGINILLNNCHPDVSDRYINFTDNMSAINFKNFNKSQLVHRCFCGLASQIGFKNEAVEPYQLVTTFAACRQNVNQAQNISSDKNLGQVYQPPVSNVLSTVVKDLARNTHQLMSQGSADMLLSMCTDYWDGKDISPLTRYDRSRVLDFYKRNIFSSYCLAFAYSPLINRITLNEMGDQFILLMPEIKDKVKTMESTVDTTKKHLFRENPSINKLSYEKSQLNYFADSTTSGPNRLSMAKKLEDVENLLNHQIFLGMVSMQADRVQSDVIDCINRLEQACIRFVFFSVDNQLRSRVFAERLGMESGWNCHISLADPSAERRKSFSVTGKFDIRLLKHSYDTEMVSKDELSFKTFSNSEPILHRARMESDQIVHSTTLPDAELSIIPKLEILESENLRRKLECHSLSDTSSSMSSESLKEGDTFMEDPQDHFREDKSKLPCGIRSIRPHLENIDNVPLQVSLFTDCTPEVDQEMMNIMREYGEVICCCGSSLSLQNIPLFSSSDCAVAFIPILHKKCSRQHEDKIQNASLSHKTAQLNKDHNVTEEEPLLKRQSTVMDHNIALPVLSPINMASRLIGMPCGLIFDRTKGFHLITFIAECHRLVKNSLSSIAFYCLSCASFALLKLLINLLIVFYDCYYMNTKFYIGLDIFPWEAQIIYYFYFHTPILAMVIYTKMDMIGKPLKEPPRKRVRILTFKQCKRFILASIGRFIPSVTICFLVFLWNILILYPEPIQYRSPYNTTSVESEKIYSVIPKIIGDFLFVQYNMYIIIVSLFYMTLEKQFWKFNCLKNFLWPVAASTLFTIQFLYLIISWSLQSHSEIYILIWSRLFFPILVSICGIFLVLAIGFISNNWESKALSVEHRLARLYFGTKLGMYSPV